MKRGVFGNKATPMDAVKMSKPMPRQKQVTIKVINGGFIVSCSPETHDDYRDVEHAAKTLSAAMKIAKEHFGEAGSETNEADTKSKEA